MHSNQQEYLSLLSLKPQLIALPLIIALGTIVLPPTQVETDTVQKLLAPEDAEGFGQSIAAFGNWLVVGAPEAEGTGAVFAYVCQTECTLAGELTAPELAQDDQFGATVAIHEDTILVAALGDDDNGVDAGAVYAFPDFETCLDENECETLAKLLPSDGAALSAFGFAMDFDGDHVVVGAPEDSNIADSKAGAVYVFEALEDCPQFDSERIGQTECNETYKLTASDGASLDGFGFSVALDGYAVVAGAPDDDNATGVNGGAVYFFPDVTRCDQYERGQEGETVCNELSKLLAEEEQIGLRFGHSVDIQNDVAVVGAPDARRVGPKSGAIFIFSDVTQCPIFYRGAERSTQCNEDVQIAARAAQRDAVYGAQVMSDGTTLIVASPGDFTSATANVFPGSLSIYDSLFDCPEFDSNIITNFACLQSELLTAVDALDGDQYASQLAWADDRLFVTAFAASERELAAEGDQNTPSQATRNRGGAVYMYSIDAVDE